MKTAQTGLSPWVKRENMFLLTDLYELTMMAGYLEEDMNNTHVSFEYFFRNLPKDTGFGIFAGLEQVLSFLDNLYVDQSDIDYLASLDIFPSSFLDWLSTWQCTCDAWSIPEGTLVYPNEPLFRIEGPLGQAQLLETFVLNALNYPTLIATKSARVCLAAEGDPVMEFGLRRAQGPDGGLIGSRSAYIGGCIGTSNCLAGKTYQIPVMGTHAHSWVMAFSSEIEAFRAYLKTYPGKSTLLVDTYDVLGSGVPNAIQAYKELRKLQPDVRASIRIDSGDLAKLSKGAWQQLTDAGFSDPMIIASNDLDELLIADIKRQGAKINAWGVGTHLITSGDDPALSGVYKLTAVQTEKGWEPKIKVSSNIGKLTNPGRKQLYRFFDIDNCPIADVLCLADETPPDADWTFVIDQTQLLLRRPIKPHSCKPLLQKVMENGKIITDQPSLRTIRDYTSKQIQSLRPEMTRLRNPDVYPVGLSNTMAKLKRQLIERF